MTLTTSRSSPAEPAQPSGGFNLPYLSPNIIEKVKAVLSHLGPGEIEKLQAAVGLKSEADVS